MPRSERLYTLMYAEKSNRLSAALYRRCRHREAAQDTKGLTVTEAWGGLLGMDKYACVGFGTKEQRAKGKGIGGEVSRRCRELEVVADLNCR